MTLTLLLDELEIAWEMDAHGRRIGPQVPSLVPVLRTKNLGFGSWETPTVTGDEVEVPASFVRVRVAV